MVYIEGWLDRLQDPALPAASPADHVMENNNDSMQNRASCFHALSQAHCQEWGDLTEMSSGETVVANGYYHPAGKDTCYFKWYHISQQTGSSVPDTLKLPLENSAWQNLKSA